MFLGRKVQESAGAEAQVPEGKALVAIEYVYKHARRNPGAGEHASIDCHEECT